MGSPSVPECIASLERMTPMLLDTAIRSVVVLGLAGMAAVVMRRASAAARHWVWLWGFAGLLVLPVLTTTMPGWRVLPRWVAQDAIAPGYTIVDGPTFPDAAEAVQDQIPDEARRAETPGELSSADPHVTTPAPAVTSATPAIAVSPVEQTAPGPASARTALPWTFWLVSIWLGGSLLVVGHVLLGYLSLWRLQRRCARVRHGEWPRLLGQLRQKLDIHREVDLLSSPWRTMPMTWGLWRSRLLLPAQAESWSAEQCRAVLLHELGHVRRHDCLTQLVAQIACAVYWFNPLVWVAWRRMQVEREHACDDLVLNAGARASTYAQHLLHSVTCEGIGALRFVGAAVAMARPSTLEERLRAILDTQRNRRGLGHWGAILTILVLAAALVPVAVLRAQANPAPTPVGGTAMVTATSPGITTGGTVGESANCTLEATVYEVLVPVEQVGQWDVERLRQAAANTTTFEKALAALGTTKPRYHTDQAVRLSGDIITITSQTPYVTNSQRSRDGQVLNSVSYASTGAVFCIAGKTSPTGNITLDLSIQVSTLNEDMGVAISDTVKAPAFHNVTMVHKGPVTAQQPFVTVSAYATSLDANSKAVLYIARMTLGTPR